MRHLETILLKQSSYYNGFKFNGWYAPYILFTLQILRYKLVIFLTSVRPNKYHICFWKMDIPKSVSLQEIRLATNLVEPKLNVITKTF